MLGRTVGTAEQGVHIVNVERLDEMLLARSSGAHRIEGTMMGDLFRSLGDVVQVCPRSVPESWESSQEGVDARPDRVRGR